MLGPIVKPLKLLANMAKAVVTLVLTLIKMLDVILDPLKIIKLLLVIAFVLLTYAIALIESFLGILTGLLSTISWFIISVLAIVFLLLKFVLKNLIFAVDYVLNDILKIDVSLRKFFYHFIFANEFAYHSWYTQHSFEKNNLPVKFGLISFSNCSKGFSPFGLLCRRYHSTLPLYSLDANIERLSRGQTTEGALGVNRFQPNDRSFYDLSKAQMQKEIFKTGILQRDYHNLSVSRLQPYDQLTKSTCMFVNELHSSSLPINHVEKIKKACYLKYCMNGEYECFCAQGNNLKIEQRTDVIEEYLHYGSLLITILLFTGIFILSRSFTKTS